MSEDANRREDRIKAALLKKVDEELKILADLKRYVFTAFLAVAVGTFNAEERLSQYVGAGTGLLLFLVFCVLIIIRYRKLHCRTQK